MSALSWSRVADEAFGTAAPPPSRLQAVRDAAAIGLFIGLFFVLFQPFGTADTDAAYKIPLLLSFGAINGVLVLVNEWLHKPLRQNLLPQALQQPWLHLIFDLLLIAFGNFLYVHALCSFAYASFLSFAAFVGKTVLIGAFPILFALLFVRMRSLERSAPPTATSPSPPLICLQSSNGKECIRLAEQEIRWIASDKNYVLIGYLDNGTFKKHVLRNTLKAIEAQVTNTALRRCHRSYLVNTACIQHVAAHRDGLQLQLHDVPDVIPVSQRYAASIRALYSDVTA